MIAHEFKLATKSIYNWLNQGKIEFSLNDLPEHGVRQRRNLDQRSKYNQSLGRSIEQRPIVVNRRNRSQITVPLGIPVKRSDDSDC